ncbi:novel protin similar to armadillo repeat containing 1 (Armc1) [Xenopus tropicalis]|uniref:Armadillo repeat-containing protein 1 n=1 Tax=Xenopus tropicalis TaxID=8364 RepID=Q0D2E3_XENTR|eukprot:NP_001037973.2 novel protin similar to armadillo repeat containing 1 (Armc1) [Xenopus tropicalis]
MNAVSVVTHLRDLASDPLNRTSIVRDKSCLAGLILFLSHQDDYVVESALKALIYLCEDPAHCGIIRNELGMMESLENLKNRYDIDDEVKQLGRRIQILLNPPAHMHTPETNGKKNKPCFFATSCNKRAKTVTLYIHGLCDAEKKHLCEEALLKVKGVISFTFQIAMQRCTVRVKPDLETECLASAIAETRVLRAQQVIRSESGNEIYVPLHEMNVTVEKNLCLPDYLPEEVSPQKDLDKAVIPTGSKNDCQGSWINAATNFLSKTFFW